MYAFLNPCDKSSWTPSITLKGMAVILIMTYFFVSSSNNLFNTDLSCDIGLFFLLWIYVTQAEVGAN